jgi:hypothetical protein
LTIKNCTIVANLRTTLYVLHALPSTLTHSFLPTSLLHYAIVKEQKPQVEVKVEVEKRLFLTLTSTLS